LVAVDGPSGSGKSTFADLLRARLTARGVTTAVVGTDDFATWDDPVAWWPRLDEGVLTPLAGGRPGGYRRIEWSAGEPGPGAWVRVPVPRVLVIEGFSSGRARIRPRLSALCWVADPDPVSRLERAVARDGEDTRPHLTAWQRFERGWYAVDLTGTHATQRVATTDITTVVTRSDQKSSSGRQNHY
ncbi:uridine kinase family protein, partial [Saccharomonospora iraqiensis]|uniref:uridine kinase family protein n=1 Tax=Saccharomonospora iraqiensis TaxID=52698 RepID=UPI00022E6E63